MTKFICPNCRGGFPEGPLDNGCCPWCEQPLNGSYEPPEPPHAIRRTVSKDDGENHATLGRKIKGWLTADD